MDIKDNIALFISVSSACAAVLSVVFSKLALERQRYMQGWIANHDLLNRTNTMLMQDHSLLGILGIEVEELARDGITPDELIYIHASMDAGHAFYRISGQRYSIITGYRKNFLENPKVRLAWKKYLRDKLFGQTAWTRAVDAYIAEFEAKMEESSSTVRLDKPRQRRVETAFPKTGHLLVWPNIRRASLGK